MDKLDEIFTLQKSYQDDLAQRRGLHDIPMEQWIQRQTLAMISELAELIDEVNFKWWKNEKPVDEGRVRDELVDILHFFVSMCLSAGMTSEELHERYTSKNKENFNRQRGLSAKKGYV